MNLTIRQLIILRGLVDKTRDNTTNFTPLPEEFWKFYMKHDEELGKIYSELTYELEHTDE